MKSAYIIRPSSIISSIRNLDQLFKSLIDKKDDGFVFRGQADAKWCLEPKLFRKGEIEKSSKYFPLSDFEIQKNWFENKNTLLTVDSYFGNKLNINKSNYKHVIFFHKGNQIPLVRLLCSYVNIMKYNYGLYQYTSDNQSYYADEYLEKIKDRQREFWADYSTFIRLLEEILYLVDRREIYTDSLLNTPEIFNGLSSYDETRPQHYDIATSVLDWTKNLYKALYFACNDFIDYQSSMESSITAPCKSKYISIFCYKQLHDHDDASVRLTEPNLKILNERVQKQDGMFTWMPMARSFYLIHNAWPTLDYYFEVSGGKLFLIEKYVIELNESTIFYIQKKLEELKINVETMGLSSESELIRA